MIKVHTRFDLPVSPSITFKGPSMTRKEFATDADINHILERYQETGFLVDPLHPSTRRPMFGDFSNVQDYQSALDALNQAQDDFMQLPARVRARFENNPQKLLDFLNNPDNIDEAISLGLLEKKSKIVKDDQSNPDSDRKADSESDK